jgi:acetylornithine deacetylase/succinyl-diaminopimelate desuccinylase-like protein
VIRFLCAVAVLLWGVTGNARAAEIDWADVEKQATEFLSAYIQIDTSNPPGNESAATRFLADRFHAAGIEAQQFEAAPGRGSVLARLRGAGGARPVILLNHLDVVPATPDGWDVPPFSGMVRDGYVYGRGALDCKGVGTIDALALLLMKRNGIGLKRDVIFLGTADEEAGGQLGAGWMVAHHFDQFRDAEFVLNEGGHIQILPNAARAYEVAVSEKTPCWLRLTTDGAAGHGSSPPPETAVTRLVRALDHIVAYQPEVRVLPEVAAYYAALAETGHDARQAHYKDLRGALMDAQLRAEFLGNPHDAALVRNTLTPTVLTGSQKTNVIPRTASAEVDCRLLPGQDPAAFVATVKDVIADPAVKVDVLLNFPPSSSSTDTALYAAIRALAGRDAVPVVPSVLTGFTDSHYFRAQGITSYGFVPIVLSEGETRREHGVNERISTDNLRDGVRRLIDLLHVLDGQEAHAAGERSALSSQPAASESNQ